MMLYGKGHLAAVVPDLHDAHGGGRFQGGIFPNFI